MTYGPGHGSVSLTMARKKLGEGMRSVKNEFNELVSHETSKLTSREQRAETPKNGLVAS